MNKNDSFYYLIQKYASGNIAVAEKEELFEMVISNQYDTQLSQLLLHEFEEGHPDEKTILPPHVSEEIIRNIYKAEKNISKVLALPKQSLRIKYWAVAACIAGLIFSLYYFNYPASFKTSSFAALIPDSTVMESNTTRKVKVVMLTDGSKVSLQPNSRLHYPKLFAAAKREVYLEGGAFFQISKNPQRPFLVYYNNIVTKVLGTSFNIKTDAVTGNVEVVVKTGKVQVYENERLIKKGESDNAVIITPNQKAIYKETTRLFQTILVEKPEPIAGNEDPAAADTALLQTGSLVYEQEKLQNIFSHLAKRYGIAIDVENSNINNCVFSGDISDNNLYNKLTIICLTINATYQINGTTILIKGNGCK